MDMDPKLEIYLGAILCSSSLLRKPHSPAPLLQVSGDDILLLNVALFYFVL